MRVYSKLMLLVTALFLVAAACGDDDASPQVSATTTPATSTTAAPSTTTTAAPSTTTPAALIAPQPADVAETYTIPGFGYSIAYPVGWFTETRGSITAISQTEEQSLARFADPVPPRVALGANLDHRTVAFLQGIGLTIDDPTPQDLLEFNINNFDWTDVQDLGEVEIFGTTAVVVRITNPDGDFAIEYQGVRPDTGEIFLFGFGAPTEESLEASLPAWEAMLESITAIG